MRKRFQIALTLLLLLGLGLPVQAEIADFFKGELGMSPGEIQALAGPPARGPAPVDYEYTQDLGFDRYLSYNTHVLDFEAYTVYYFTRENGLQLVTVSIPLTNVPLAEQQAILLKTQEKVVDPQAPLTHANRSSEVETDEYRQIYHAHWWLNKTYFITMHSSASIVKQSRQNQTNISSISLSFNGVAHANEATRLAIEQFKAEINAGE